MNSVRLNSLLRSAQLSIHSGWLALNFITGTNPNLKRLNMCTCLRKGPISLILVSEIWSTNRYRYISISKLVTSILSVSNQKFSLFSAIRYISSFLQNKMYNVLILLCFFCELKWIATLLTDVNKWIICYHKRYGWVNNDHLVFSAFLLKKFLTLISISDIDKSVFH